MKPEQILKADMLDILFENRNKDYGAYTLRRDYNGRLMRGIAVMFSVVLLFIAGTYWKADKKSVGKLISFIGSDQELTKIEIEKLKIPEPPKVQHAASIQHTTPVIVQETNSTVAELEDLSKDVSIGTETHGGPPPVTSAPPSPESVVTPAAPIEPPKEPAIWDRSEIMPEFPGGDAAMRRFLQKNMRFDFEEMEAGSRIEIRCRFVVDKDGKVKGIEITKTGGRNDFDKEVTRVIAKMPDWKPGFQNGRNVAVYFTLPVIVEVPEQ
jgi:protein TonB